MPKSVSIHIESRTHDWQRQLAQAISNTDELLAALNIPPQQRMTQVTGCGDFPLRVTRHYLDKIRPGDLQDPLLLQVLVRAREFDAVPGYQHDPVGDLASVKAPGLLHKYHGRALLITTAACAIHCRYCFRRHFPYPDANPMPARWQAVRDALLADETIEELILSGGDPLSLADHRLAGLLEAVGDIPQLKRLRLHSRYPIILPERLNRDLLNLLQGRRQQIILVLHANHANEIDTQVRTVLAPYREAGITLLNQAVLLRGVNDSETALTGLSEALFDAGVLPYYLHQLDPVQGAAHFAVTETEALALLAGLRARLPGYLVPKLVREQPGESAKTPLV